ncbi:MAG: leucine-rich repeat protein [Acidobacteria bacterium]|nr:leucine-rich repeat protein [Acidobacteriota bacterium]
MRTRIRATDTSGDPSDPFSLPSALKRALERPLALPVVASALFLAALEACDPGGVAEPEPSLEIVPDSVTLTHIGEQFSFTVRGGGGLGASQVQWSSRDTSVFTVDAAGTVTARRNGSAYVRAADLKSADHAVVQVHQVADALEPFGGGQQAARGLSPPDPVGVRVLDAGGAPVSGVAVRFEAGVGGGRVEPGVVHSESAGLAAAQWTLGPEPGRQTLAVSAEGVADVEIAATALSPDEAVASVEVRSGQDQSAWAGRALAEPVVVLAMDEGGRPLPGATVRFEPGAAGVADPETAVSDSAGLAATGWTLGTAFGPQTLTASAGVASVEIRATARDPDAAVALVEVHSGEDQWALAGHTLPSPVSVRVMDEIGRPIWGAAVRFEPDEGSGSVDLEAATTDSLGLASAVWTLGLELGKQRLRAKAGDASMAFEATAVSDAGVCNRTPTVSAEIASRLGVGSCANVTKQMLGGVTKVFVNRQGIKRLRSGDFTGLVGLTALELTGNKLSELPPDIFAGLSRLRRLSLDHNQLSELPTGIFRGLSGLKDLGLRGNRLTALDEQVFSDLDQLEILFIDYNELKELPSGLFDELSQLKNLVLTENRLTSLSENIFADLSSLEAISLGANQLTELPSRLFANKPALFRIQLRDNRLTELPPGLFFETPALQRLWLRGNLLHALPPSIFAGLHSLVRLDLDRNIRLAELPPGLFAGTPKLAELSLEWNDLTELPTGVFAGLSELKWVTLAGNPGAPFQIRPEFARVDVGDPLAPGPARVVVRTPLGAPFAFEMPVSVQRGSISREIVSVLAGDTVSTSFEVSAYSGGGAAHVGFGPPPQLHVAGYSGVELVRGEELVLFAETDNRSPDTRSHIPQHRLQVGGPSASVAVGDYFNDPDGDTLAYEVVASVSGVVDARIEQGVLWLDPLSMDTTEVEVTAIDPGGLRATQRFLTWVVPAPDPDAFNIELYFDPGFTPEQEATIRRAADRWMEVVTGDLPDVPMHGSVEEYCGDRARTRFVGVIDDVLIRIRLFPYLRNAAAYATSCGRREESGLDFLGENGFAQRTVDSSVFLPRSALHEIGHILGIGDWPIEDRDTDPHFAGPLAVEAFDAAGGEGYPGGKVPVEDQPGFGGGGRLIHWRNRVIPDDVMSPVGGDLVTAITLQALADLGHEVDLTKADPYKLPGQAQGNVQGLAADAGESVAELWADDVIEGPVVVVDRNGKVVRVIRR